MAVDRVITAATITLSVTPRGGQNVVIGRALSLDVSEQYGVRPIVGIGQMNAQELPILSYAGALSLSSFAVDSRATQTLLSEFQRMGTVSVPDATTFLRQLMQTDGIDITVMRKVRADDGTVSDQTLAKISGAVCTNERLEVREQDVVTRSGSFVFAQPISI